jgi:hypothetical protein
VHNIRQRTEWRIILVCSKVSQESRHDGIPVSESVLDHLSLFRPVKRGWYEGSPFDAFGLTPQQLEFCYEPAYIAAIRLYSSMGYVNFTFFLQVPCGLEWMTVKSLTPDPSKDRVSPEAVERELVS